MLSESECEAIQQSIEYEAAKPVSDRSICWNLTMMDKECKQLMLAYQMEETDDQLIATHGWVLGYIERNKDNQLYQKDLEKAFHMPRSTMTGVLQSMEKNGLIYRSAVEHDARLKQICITEKGMEFCKLTNNNFKRMEDVVKSNLSKDEEEAFFNTIDKIRASLVEELKKKGGSK